MTARWGSLSIGLLILVVAVAGSIALGSTSVPLSRTLEALAGDTSTADHLTIIDERVPRTVLALLVGAALGVAGALVQAMTRNPLADPGILGVNAGAMFGVALGVGFAGATGISSYRWWALAGAGLATLVVYGIGSTGGAHSSPVRLTLAGVALAAVLMGGVSGMALLDPAAFAALRSFTAGSVAGRDLDAATTVLPLVALGLLIAFAVAPLLNLVVLGDDLTSSLGVDPRLVRVLTVVAVTLLAGAATAAAGPISFVGLIVAHVVRPLVGGDQRWVVAFALVGGGAVCLVADVIGRFVVAPGELPVGVMTAFLGAPVLIAVARSSRVSEG